MSTKYVIWNSEKVIKVLEGDEILEVARYTSSVAEARITEYDGVHVDFLVTDERLYAIETKEIDTWNEVLK
jgi:hypothetical protein